MSIKESKIKWEYVFLVGEAREYFNKNELIQISLLNKLLRSKLTSILFNSIELNWKNLPNHPNYFVNQEDPWGMANKTVIDRFKTYSMRLGDRNILFKTTRIDPFSKEFQLELSANSFYMKHLIFSKLYKPCYYLFPIVINFTGLTSLNINDCYINLRHFIGVMESLVNLQRLELDYVTFVKSPKDDTIENELIFPQSLTELSWFYCYIVISCLPQRSYEFVFGGNFEFLPSSFEPQPCSYPELKKLEFNHHSRPSIFNNDWFLLNPQILELRAYTSDLNRINLELISSNNTLKSLYIRLFSGGNSNSVPNFPILNSITKLTLFDLSNSLYSNIQKLYESCPNLIELELGFGEYDEDFISKLESKLINLSVLSLEPWYETDLKYKIPSFVHIKHLKLSFGRNTIRECVLPPPSQLNLITVKNQYKLIKINNFKNSNNFWKLKNNENNITCTLTS